MGLPHSEADRYFSVISGCGRERHKWVIPSGNGYLGDHNGKEITDDSWV